MQGGATTPCILGCFGGIEVCVQEARSVNVQQGHSENGYAGNYHDGYGSATSATSLGLSSYGKLQTLHEEDEENECEEDDDFWQKGGANNNNNYIMSTTETATGGARRWGARSSSSKSRARRVGLRRDGAAAAHAEVAHEKRTLLMRWARDSEEIIEHKGNSNNRLGVVKSKLKSSTRLVAHKLKRACEHLVKLAQRSTPHMADLFLTNNQLLLHLTGGGGVGAFSPAAPPHSPPLPPFHAHPRPAQFYYR